MKSSHLRLKNAVALLIALVCVVALAGCSDPKAKVAGTYEIDKAAIKAAAEADIKAKGENNPQAAEAGFMLGMIDAMNITMTLNADGTASMSMNMMGQADTASGTWTISGKSITITAAKSGETPEAITGTVTGDTIKLQPPKGQEMPFDMIFTKKKT